MISTARIAVSRANGAKSNGPVTQEGKKKSSMNAVRHGLMATRLVMTEEEQEWAADLRHDLAMRFSPYDALEMDAVDAIVVVMVKLQRLDQIEFKAMNQILEGESTNEPERPKLPTLETLGRYRNRLMKERREAEERLEQHLRQRPETFGPGPDRLRFMADVLDKKANDDDTEAASDCANENASINEPEAQTRVIAPMAKTGNARILGADISGSPHDPNASI